MNKVLRIGTRESQLAVWQATQVKDLLKEHGYNSELVYIKSEGDIDLKTPLYEMGVQGIFTRSLDIALLTNRIDLAVHSMKDVPTRMANGIVQSAVLERGSFKDILVYKGDPDVVNRALGFVDGRWSTFAADVNLPLVVATSSVRRAAQWLHRFPNHGIENLRGNVNTRLRKLQESNWNGAIFAAAGLERIGLRPQTSIELDWMLPAPAQGAILVACRGEDSDTFRACTYLNHEETALCTAVEKEFLRTLAGGCSTPIGALAQVRNGEITFRGNIFSADGKNKAETEMTGSLDEFRELGAAAARNILADGGQEIAEGIQHEKQ